MGLKILCTGDWHLDSPLPDRPELRQAQLGIPGAAADLCRREQCDLVLLGGDLFDGEYTRESLEAVRRACADMAVPVFIAPGNHDFVGGAGPFGRETFPGNVHVFLHPQMERVALPEISCSVYGAGYDSMDCPGLLEGFSAEPEDRYRIGVLHGDPTTASSPCCPVTRGQLQSCGLQLLALGHIHKTGSVRVGDTLCLWPGSPMGRDFGECGDKGAWVVTLEDRAEAEFHSLSLPCFYETRCSGENLQLPAEVGRNYYRITVTGYRGKEPLPRIPGVTWVDQTRGELNIWQDLEEDSFSGAYFRRLHEKWQAGDKDALTAAEISRRLLDGEEVPLC